MVLGAMTHRIIGATLIVAMLLLGVSFFDPDPRILSAAVGLLFVGIGLQAYNKTKKPHTPSA